jgi:hypothetical protein
VSWLAAWRAGVSSLAALAGGGRTMPGDVPEQPEDTGLERLEPEQELEAVGKEPDSWLPKFLVDEQEELARMTPAQLGERMASLVVATALRRPGSTPRGVLNEVLESVSDDETWRDKVGPELRRVLTARGVEVELEADEPKR